MKILEEDLVGLDWVLEMTDWNYGSKFLHWYRGEYLKDIVSSTNGYMEMNITRDKVL